MTLCAFFFFFFFVFFGADVPREKDGELILIDEFVLRDQILELVLADVVVVDAVLLAGAGAPGSVGDGESKDSRVLGKQRFVERALADAAGARDDDGAAVGGEVRRGGGRGGGGGHCVEVANTVVVVGGFNRGRG